MFLGVQHEAADSPGECCGSLEQEGQAETGFYTGGHGQAAQIA